MLYKVLIIGEGFVGKNLYNVFCNIYNTTIINRNVLDIQNQESIKNYFYNKKFNIIIYAAGLKDIKECEKNSNKAYEINSYAIKYLCNYAKFDKLIYISTDYVFDGDQGNYKETDTTNPTTIYGKSKLLGEKYTLNLGDKGIVVRTSGIFGDNCNWIEWLKNEINSNNIIECFDDVYNSPTYVYDLAYMMKGIIEHDYFGIINLCGSNVVNRYELFKTFAVVNNFDTKNLIISKNNGIFPHNLSLNNDKFCKMFNYTSLPLTDSFEHLKRNK